MGMTIGKVMKIKMMTDEVMILEGDMLVIPILYKMTIYIMMTIIDDDYHYFCW